MRIIDISQPIEDSMVYYSSLTSFKFNWLKHYSRGDNRSISEFCMASHIGAHIDSPYHYIPNGKKLDELDLEVFYGKARIIEVENEQKITAEFLKKVGDLPERILFKTRNSQLYNKKSFTPDYVYIDSEAAKYISQFPVKLIGIDYLSIDKYQDTSKDAHKILLSKGIVLLEGIILTEVDEGNYQIACFPIKIKGVEAAPCRAVLIDDKR